MQSLITRGDERRRQRTDIAERSRAKLGLDEAPTMGEVIKFRRHEEGVGRKAA